jgi:hypothetical protein
MTTREYKILGAASARSTIDEFTVWAQRCRRKYQTIKAASK